VVFFSGLSIAVRLPVPIVLRNRRDVIMTNAVWVIGGRAWKLKELKTKNARVNMHENLYKICLEKMSNTMQKNVLKIFIKIQNYSKFQKNFVILICIKKKMENMGKCIYNALNMAKTVYYFDIFLLNYKKIYSKHSKSEY